jgi:hypothetical protein
LTAVPAVRSSRYLVRRLAAVGLAAVGIAVLVIALSGSPAPSVGYDISYPQCPGSYPSNPLFGIVGVNGGLANDANPCLGGELRWARQAPGQRRPKQPRVSLYIDTGNPGDHAADWPRAGTTPAYGVCNGLLTNACSYIYGEQRASRSYRLLAALEPRAARTAPWWLDVELMATWAGTYQLNIAALQGFLAGLRNAGAAGPIGIYSTSAQWQEITGLTPQSTRASFGGPLPDWVAGTGTTAAQARQSCAGGDFTGAAPSLAQYRIGPLDADLRCPLAR